MACTYEGTLGRILGLLDASLDKALDHDNAWEHKDGGRQRAVPWRLGKGRHA